MAILPRAALLLLALAVAVAPAVAADETGGSDPSGGSDGSAPPPGGNGTSDPVQGIEDCVCNETGNQTEPEPECTLPGCVTDPEERAACSPADLDLFSDSPANAVEVDPQGCYRAAVTKALSGAPPIVRNAVCSLLSRLP